MKSDRIQYEWTYQRLKDKIESGILPVGAKLPGRSVLCKELGTSERTVRRALKLLEQDGFLEIASRKRPKVISASASPVGRAEQSTKRADAEQVNDLMQTSVLLCYPVYLRGLSLCAGGDWRTPETILGKMDPNRPEEFWRLSSRLWRYFIARNENELLLRAVECLGFRGKEPPPGSPEDRARYRSHIEALFRTVKGGGEPGQTELNAIFSQYRGIAEQASQMQFHQQLSPCPMLARAQNLEQQLSVAQERYTSVCLDILGMITLGRYQPGDRLPTHDQLQEYYGISRDTSVKAVRLLREWGVVTAAPRRGILVELDPEALQKIQIDPRAIASHLRRYLDSLELLSLTAEGVAAHAAAHASPADLRRLQRTLRSQWDAPYAHQLIPRTFQNFITDQIQHDAMRSIYRVLGRNLSTGRSIPRLASRDRNAMNERIYSQCIEAVDSLAAGDAGRFARMSADMFELVRDLIVQGCMRLGYWDAAMKVYDGAALWK